MCRPLPLRRAVNYIDPLRYSLPPQYPIRQNTLPDEDPFSAFPDFTEDQIPAILANDNLPDDAISPLNDSEIKQLMNPCPNLCPPQDPILNPSGVSLSTLSDNNKYEEDVDQWFSKPLPQTEPPPPPPPPPPPTPLPPPEGILPTPPTPFAIRQYTPTYTHAPRLIKSGADQMKQCDDIGPHDPRGHPTTKNTNWSIAHWDGVPFDMAYDANGNPGKTKAQMHAFLVPDHKNNPFAIRGLEEFFYQRKPFADNNNPTVPEIDTWNLEVIRHIRTVMGAKVKETKVGEFAGKVPPIFPDARLYLECAWSDARKHTQSWDEIYSGGVVDKNGVENFGYAPGPCWLPLPPPNPQPGKTRPQFYTPHCGETFAPSNPRDSLPFREAAPYFFQTSSFGHDSYDTLPPRDPLRMFRPNFYATNPPYKELYQHGTLMSSAAGLSGSSKNIPWSHRAALVFANFIKDEGDAGHAGPWFYRPYVGLSWFCNPDGGIAVRGKWGGRFRADNGKLDVPFLGWTKIGS